MSVRAGTETTSTGGEDELAWGELRFRLRSFVAARIGDATLSDDLVQEILLRLHRGLPKLRESSRLDAFAYQIARNVIADHYRRSSPEEAVDPADLAEQLGEETLPDDDGAGEARAGLARCLRPLVDRLPEQDRTALLLTDLGELSQAEAARRLRLSAPGMRSRVQRGRGRLRDALGRCCRVDLNAAAQIDRVERVGPCACD